MNNIYLVQYEVVDLQICESSCETFAYSTKKEAEEKVQEFVSNITRIGSPYPTYKEEVNEDKQEHSYMWFDDSDNEWGGYFNKHILISVSPYELLGDTDQLFTTADVMHQELMAALETDEELNDKLVKYYHLDNEEKYNSKIDEIVEQMISDNYFWDNYCQELQELIYNNEIVKPAYQFKGN